MVFPLGDDNSARRTMPVVTIGHIALNVVFFLVELNGGDAFIRQWAFIPGQFGQNPAGEAHTVFTAMFMHGGCAPWGNMLYLWISETTSRTSSGPSVPESLSV